MIYVAIAETDCGYMEYLKKLLLQCADKKTEVKISVWENIIRAYSLQSQMWNRAGQGVRREMLLTGKCLFHPRDTSAPPPPP